MKIAVVSKMNHNSLISTAYHNNIMKFFSKNHDLTILTNATSFLKRQGVKAKYINISFFPFSPINHFLINDNIINLKLKKVDYDMLVIWYDSLLFFQPKKPVFRFVDICPYQSFGYSKKGDKMRFYQNMSLKMLINSFKKSSFILTNSPQMKQFLIDCGLLENQIKWLPMGVDLTRFSTTAFPDKQEEYTLINTGQFLSVRGGNMIIKSMKMLSNMNEDIKYVSLGNSNGEFKEWIPIFEKMGLKSNIKLHGVVDNKRIPEFIAKAKIGISILEKNEYYTKSPPQKIFEYMAMGLPVIANDIPTHTDYIKNGYNGFIVDSAEEMVETILKLKNDKNLYKKISDNSKESAKKYSMEKIELKLKKYVNNLANA